MAKRKSQKKTVSTPVRDRKSAARVGKRMRSVSRKSGLKWGEIILSALVGWKGDYILQPVGQPIATAMFKSQYGAEYLGPFIDKQNGDVALGTAEGVNKALGLASVGKVAYDIVKHKRMNDTDLNILLPYAIGTVFDGPESSVSGSSGGWK